MDGANSIERYYVYGEGLLYSVDNSTGERSFHHHDHIGNTVVLSNFESAITNSEAYLPYGKSYGGNLERDTVFGFAGRLGVMKEDNGLYFMRARFYDPDTRSFLGQDSVGGSLVSPKRLNLYQYGLQNPLRYLDANGREPVSLTVLGVGLLAYSVYNTVWSLEKAALSAYTAPDGQKLEVLRHDLGMIAVGSNFPILGEAAAFQEGKAYGDRFWCGPSLGCQIGAFFHSKESSGGDYSAHLGRLTNTLISSLINGKSGSEGGYYQFDVDEKDSNTLVGGQVNRTVGIETTELQRYLTENNGPETAWIRRKFHFFRGDEGALARWIANQTRSSSMRRSLGVRKYAQGRFDETYRYILAEDFLDQQTLSYVEGRVAQEIASLSQRKYRYNPDSARSKRRAKERRAADVSRSVDALYSQLLSALSKHQVVVRELSAMPAGEATGGIALTGVYAGGGN